MIKIIRGFGNFDFNKFRNGKNFSRLIYTSECDYVIVGSGSAGSVLANRLSEPSAGPNEVLVLEAGPSDQNWKISMPAALMYCLKDPKYSWCYTTSPQVEINNRVFFWPRGKVVGGSSSINAMVYIRGHAFDYDRWEREGATGWSFFECLPYFKKAQCHELGENLYRGGNGPLHVSRGKLSNPLYNIFVQAGMEAGYEYTNDCNGYKQDGFGPFDMTIKNGHRWSTSAAYLWPALENNKNLRLHIQAKALQILFNNKKATGVKYLHQGELKVAMARKEIIICAGSINTPQLLLLSGIGNYRQLKNLNISLVSNLPGLGQNLQDHLEVFIQYRCKRPITLYKYQWKFPHNMIKTGLQWFLTSEGPASTSHLEAGAFIKSSESALHPDIQLHFLPSVIIDHGQKMANCHAYQAHAGTLRATSTGQLRLKSNNPHDAPIIEPRYLSTKQDLIDFRACVRRTKEIFAQKAFDEFNAGFLKPNVMLETDKEIDDFVKNTAETAYHPCGTARMGSENDTTSVVDPECRVIGVENLRVVDASIMPSIISGNLNAPVIMIAEKAADMILGKKKLPKVEVPIWIK